MRRLAQFLFVMFAIALSVGLLATVQRSAVVRSKLAELDLPDRIRAAIPEPAEEGAG